MLRILTLVLLSCAVARADVAFALQPAIGVGTSVEPLDTSVTTTASSSVPRESSRMVPTLRLGVDFGSLMLLGYGSNSNAGVQNHQVSGFTRAGVLLEPVLWRSDDDRVAIYFIGGGGLVAVAGTTVSVDAMMGTKFNSFTATGATFFAGVGGSYAVHPNLALGLELAIEPDLVSLASGTYIGDQAIVSVTGTFVTCRTAVKSGASGH